MKDGGVLDDIIVSRDAKNWIMVVNASNREKLVKYFTEDASNPPGWILTCPIRPTARR